MKNVLFIGNGINLQLYNDVPLWNELLAEESEKIHTDIFRRENGLTAQNEDIKISNNTLQYESIVLKSGVSDNALKEKIERFIGSHGSFSSEFEGPET